MKRKSRFFLMSLVAIFILSACEKEEDSQTVLYGIVSDYKSNEPLKDATVVLYSGVQEIARSQVTGDDGRYEMILDKAVILDVTSFYVKASGYEAVSMLDVDDNLEIGIGQTRQVDLAMYDWSAFPIRLSIKSADMVNYFYSSSITILNASGMYFNNLNFTKFQKSYVTDSFNKRWSVRLNLGPREDYKYTSLWFEGDRFVVSAMGMSKSFWAKSDSF